MLRGEGRNSTDDALVNSKKPALVRATPKWPRASIARSPEPQVSHFAPHPRRTHDGFDLDHLLKPGEPTLRCRQTPSSKARVTLRVALTDIGAKRHLRAPGITQSPGLQHAQAVHKSRRQSTSNIRLQQLERCSSSTPCIKQIRDPHR